MTRCTVIKADGERCKANARSDGSEICFFHGDPEAHRRAAVKGGRAPKPLPVKLVERPKKLDKAPLWIITLDEAFQEEDPLGGDHMYIVAETTDEVLGILGSLELYWLEGFFNFGVCGDVYVVR